MKRFRCNDFLFWWSLVSPSTILTFPCPEFQTKSVDIHFRDKTIRNILEPKFFGISKKCICIQLASSVIWDRHAMQRHHTHFYLIAFLKLYIIRRKESKRKFKFCHTYDMHFIEWSKNEISTFFTSLDEKKAISIQNHIIYFKQNKGQGWYFFYIL